MATSLHIAGYNLSDFRSIPMIKILTIVGASTRLIKAAAVSPVTCQV